MIIPLDPKEQHHLCIFFLLLSKPEGIPILLMQEDKYNDKFSTLLLHVEW